MNFHCASCDRQVAVASFRTEGSSLFLVCAECGAEAKTEAPARPALRVIEGEGKGSAEDSFSPPPGHCPKCIAPREPEQEACARCGLTFEKFSEAEVAPATPLRVRWVELVGKWSETEKHDRLLAYAASAAQLTQVARLYRIRLARAPDDTQAARALQLLVEMTFASTMQPSPEPRDLRWTRWAMVAMAAFALVALVSLWFRMMGRG